jgi:AbrB family looped-hinge helix DNA binding protein
MDVVVDKFGRMVLPKAIRDDLGLKPGDVLDATEEGDAIILRPRARQNVVRRKEGLLVSCGVAVGDVAKAVEEHRGERVERAAAWKQQP